MSSRTVGRARLVLTGALLLAATFASLAGVHANPVGSPSDMTGTWVVTFSPPSGDRVTEWVVEQGENGTLTGEIGLLQGSAPVEDGLVEGNDFAFRVTPTARGQTFEISFSGTFDDDTLEGIMVVAGGILITGFTGARSP